MCLGLWARRVHYGTFGLGAERYMAKSIAIEVDCYNVEKDTMHITRQNDSSQTSFKGVKMIWWSGLPSNTSIITIEINK